MKKIYLLIAVISISMPGVLAQPSFNLYHLNSVGQTNLLNPAHMPRHGFTLGIPMIFQHVQTPNITVHDIFRKDLDADKTIKRILDDKNINFENINMVNEITPIFLGLKIRRNYFSAGFYTQLTFNYGLPKELFGMLYYGNAGTEYFGKKVDLSGTQFSANGMSVTHFGYTREINQKLSVGGRFKLLNGWFNLDTKKTDAYIETKPGDNNVYKITVFADYEFRAAGINTLQDFSDSTKSQSQLVRNYMFSSPVGRGYGFDLGVNYRLNKRWQFSFSALDLGSIKWKDSDAKVYKRTGTFVFEGIKPENADSFNKEFKNLLDSMGRIFEPVESNQAYSTSIIPKFYLDAQFNLTPSTRLNATFYGDRYREKNRIGYSVGLSQQIWRLFDLRVNYNAFNGKFTNLGAGVVMNFTPMQIFAMSDNILAVVNPEKAHFTNFRVGMNFILGSNWDRDGDGIKNKKDRCPKQYGLAIYKGCPDTDGDGVPDPDDKCPKVPGSIYAFGCPDADKDSVPDFMDSCANVAGLKSLNGCPDADGDGIADKNDECPNEAGTLANRGCPDTDGDGIIDKEDDCPNEAGPASTKGCPDRDGDGIPDNDDLCPDVAGTKEGKGCLDRDGDGVNDPDDECPEVPGLAKFKGCPDRDGDGIPDHLDKCPDAAGLPVNDGCPVIKQSVLKVFEKALTGIQFESGKDVILKSSFPVLNDVVKVLQENPSYRLFIAGHTDNTGNAEKNLELSKARAAAVKKYIVDRGIDSKRLSSEGFGDTQPIADNNTPAGRAKNRRVEFKVQFEDFVEE
ncbi:MAG: DUF5723 family protein [Bacteroidia bacterium]